MPLACGLLLALAGVARGAAWITPADVSLSTGGSDYNAQPYDSVAMSPAGNVLFGWVTYDPSFTQATVHLVLRPAGGPAHAEQTYTTPVSGADIVLHLSVAVNDAGDAIAVWDAGGTLAYVVATRGSAFGSPHQPPVFSFQTRADDPAVALAHDGTATLVYGARCAVPGPGSSEAVALTLPPGGTPTDWSSPDGLATTSSCNDGTTYSDFRIDELPGGNAIVGFRRYQVTGTPTSLEVWSATRTSATGLFTSQRLATANTPDMPAVAVESGGASITAWSDSNGIEFDYHPRAGSDVTGGPKAAGGSAPRVAMGAGGEALVVYENGSSDPGAFQVSPAGSVAHPQTFSTGLPGISRPDVTADAAGDAVVVWRNGGDNGIEAATRPPGGAFGTPVTLGSGISDYPVAGSDGSGDVAALWMGIKTVNSALTVAPAAEGYDASPPSVRDVSIPAVLAPGKRGSFSLTASDVWGPVSTSWSFGDGTAAHGTSVSHSFRAPGHYRVTVTVTDAAGNVTRRSRTTTVAIGKPTITKAKLDKKHHTATFRFRASGPANGFECALVKKPSGKHKKKPKPRYHACSSPKTYKHLKRGRYTFFVHELNRGLAGNPASTAFKIG